MRRRTRRERDTLAYLTALAQADDLRDYLARRRRSWRHSRTPDGAILSAEPGRVFARTHERPWSPHLPEPIATLSAADAIATDMLRLGS